jgi:uncharacterized peroxidase-related enzyme
MTMTRIAALDPAQADDKAKLLFDGVQGKLGGVPNLFRVLGNSPAALQGYLDFSGALATGRLGAKVREQIALTVAETNLCGYCLSAHTFLGGKAGLSAGDMAQARQASAGQPKTDALLKLARDIVVQRGEIGDAGVQRARAAGLTDGEIIETIALVALNIFTNYVNHVAATAIDFPAVEPGRLETVA